MKLEVGMYVRTKYNGIFNIQVLETIRDINCDYIEINYIRFPRNEILKTSHNIIDLIEVGDILKINNEKYEVIYDESYEKLGILIPSRKELSIRHSALEYVFKKYNVSIVTSQQFESISYILGDSNE